MRRLFLLVAVASMVAAPAAVAKPGGTPAQLRVNHLQAEGTHNSYHRRPTMPPWTLVPEWQYDREPLDEQLAELGVRQFELDVHYRPSNAEGQRFLVHHVDGADPNSTCPLLVECLDTMRGWSVANPTHHTLFVYIEPKDGTDENGRCFEEIDCFEGMDPQNAPIADHYDELDAEVRSVIGDRLLTPADVRGPHASLRDAIVTDGWPSIDAARGRFVFILLDGGHHRDGYRVQQGADAALFTDGKDPMTDPDAAIFRVDDPRGANEQRIRHLVTAGFLVRTRGDTNLALDPDRLAAALRSGAQMISTDVPHEVAMPGGTPSRCNPVTAPPSCRSEAIERL